MRAEGGGLGCAYINGLHFALFCRGIYAPICGLRRGFFARMNKFQNAII